MLVRFSRLLFFDGETETTENTTTTTSTTTENQENTEKKPETKQTKTTVKFTPEQQGYVNSLLAEEKRRVQNTTEQLITQLETQKNLASTSHAERESLETRIESLRAEFTTKEELQRKDNDKKLKEERAAREKAEKEVATWKDRFVEDRIKTAIISSAAKHKAYDPDQILAILRPKTRLVDAIGEDNKPTGEYVPRAKIEGKGQDGPTLLDLDVDAAIKVMTEMPEKYGNLFNSGSNGGLGGLASSGRSNTGMGGGPPSDPEAYMEYRKKKGINSTRIG